MRLRTLLCVLLCLCLIGGFSNPSQAATSAEIKNELEALQQQEQALAQQIAQLEQHRQEHLTQIQQQVAQKQILDQQIALMNQQILNTQAQVTALKALIADRQDAYDHAVSAYDKLNEQYAERIRAMEESGGLSYWSVLFRANSLADFLDRLNMIQEIAQADKRNLAQLSEAAQQVREAQRELQAQQTALQDTLDQLEINKLRLAQKREEFDELFRQLAAQGQEFEELLDKSELAQQELLTQIAKKEDEFDKAAYEEWLAAQPPVVPDPGTSAPKPPASDTDWVVPVPYYTLSSVFGMRLHPIYGDYRMHQGIDMGCAEGTPIYASRGGQIEIAVYSTTAGNYVQINHGDGYRSVYMHMIYYIVSPGQYVAPGQVIGYVGNTGQSKGNHLHFGISYNGQYINPYPFIEGK